ncbi:MULTISPECIES: LuxR C-terminal-related transcriptional regulator [Bhargavaea]|uniref:LuxR C-terminal-related transcriptional regulator n=1 Tax=Bhargavaea changchunensis TaxID=2134037 RepID=A0ABW2NDL5_9BACL|nr:LuxR C-terminal-related transcriptional regulator [Bhargavaea sp. CC-171006]
MEKEQLEQLLKDYSWMINSVRMNRESLNDIAEGLTAAYGTEAAMPKAVGAHSDPVFREYIRREKRWKRISHYEKKIMAVQERICIITDDREVEVLHWLLEGKSMRWIGRHMGLSHTNIQRIKDSIVSKMVG